MSTHVADAAHVADFWGGGEDRSDGERLLDQVHAFMRRFVAFPSPEAAIATAAWVIHAHALDAFDTTPRLALLSPEPGSGKTRALEVIELLVPNPMVTFNVSAAVLFRSMSLQDSDGASLRPTVLLDEGDTIFGPRASKDHEDLRGFLNAGYRRGAQAQRAAIRGNGVVVETFPAFAAVAIAGLDDLPDTIMTRSIVVRMRRRSPGEQVEPYRRRLHGHDGNALRERIEAWVDFKHSELSCMVTDFPDGIEDRAADCWEPLIAIGDAAGPDWSQRIRQAAMAMVGQSRATGETLGIRLLADLREAFAGADHVGTSDLLDRLCALEESPWGDLRGKPLDARGLAQRLRRYGVTPRNVRASGQVVKGYAAADLHDPWTRYLSPPPQERATCATPATADPGYPEDLDDEEPAWEPDYLIDPEEEVA